MTMPRRSALVVLGVGLLLPGAISALEDPLEDLIIEIRRQPGLGALCGQAREVFSAKELELARKTLAYHLGGPDPLRTLHNLIRHEFRTGDTLLVDGLLLSRSEAVLGALAAIGKRSVAPSHLQP